MNGVEAPQPDSDWLLHYAIVVWVATLGLMGWLLRQLWSTRPSTDEVRRMMEDRQARERDDRTREIAASISPLLAARATDLHHQEEMHLANTRRFEKIENNQDRIENKLDDLGREISAEMRRQSEQLHEVIGILRGRGK